ncbi:unnamed protein product, partial [Closterium sp. Naga37s-1]
RCSPQMTSSPSLPPCTRVWRAAPPLRATGLQQQRRPTASLSPVAVPSASSCARCCSPSTTCPSSSRSTGSTGSMDEQAGRRESTGEASHGEWGLGEERGDAGEEMEVDVGVGVGVDGGASVGVEGGEPCVAQQPLSFDTVTHRRRTTHEGT